MEGAVEEKETKQAVDDRRDALEGFGGQADNIDKLIPPFGVLDQVDGRTDAERPGDNQGDGDHKEGIDDSRQH